MPKIRSDPAADIIIGCARKNKRRTKAELIQRSGITAGTFRNRLLHPEDITIGEFRKLAKESGLEDTDIIEIVRWER